MKQRIPRKLKKKLKAETKASYDRCNKEQLNNLIRELSLGNFHEIPKHKI